MIFDNALIVFSGLFLMFSELEMGGILLDLFIQTTQDEDIVSTIRKRIETFNKSVKSNALYVNNNSQEKLYYH